ncbi:hypothetical protein VA7868_04516 [Vibrio aerogenes CECT 7868]|uniref:DUF4760 domain-containing protein n=1 Tax=Vibrio aerogenes CECT 7868 TaxID=1216006 RepID=A0A1M6ETD9_9VIBR|nr:hypothetical protein [Vibrio aerogenes]SHI88741.1 hypothetical protein VA7868_04516 [Vibrio aerogenes CECT 7868]
MEYFSVIISVAALVLTFFNYMRLFKLDEKKEYKDKRLYFKTCVDETKDALEIVIHQTQEVMARRNDFDLLDSPYIGSHGFQQAYNLYMMHLRNIQQIKKELSDIYKELSSSLELGDKEAFDYCTSIHKRVADCNVRYFENYSKIKSVVDGIENIARHAKENS